MGKIFVIYEIRENEIKKSSFEASTAALKLAAELDAEVYALLIGHNVSALAATARMRDRRVSESHHHHGYCRLHPPQEKRQ